MKLFVVSFLVATALADKLQKGYLPPASAHSAGGDGHVLDTPHNHNYAIYASSVNHGIGNVDYAKHSDSQSHQHSTPAPIRVISFESNNDGSGNYAYAYETENKISVEESNQIKNQGSRNAANYVRGSYSYPGPDGVIYTVTYTADENGYQASGAHLPTPPPIPEAIQQALEYNAAHPEEDHEESSSGNDHHESHRNAIFVAQPSVPVVPHPQPVYPVVPVPSHVPQPSVPHYQPVHPVPVVPVPSSVVPQPIPYNQVVHPTVQVPSGFVPQPNYSHSHSQSVSHSHSASKPPGHPSGFVSHSGSVSHSSSSSHVRPSHGVQPNKPSYDEKSGYRY